MNEELTPRERDALRVIRDYIVMHGLSPTTAEVAALLNVSATNAYGRVRMLEAKGCIRRGENKPRSIVVLRSA